MTSLLRDERGSVFVQIAALIFAPLIIVVIATAVLSTVRTGAGLTDALTRSSQAQLIFDEYTRSVTDATTVTPLSSTRFRTATDPAQLPPTLTREVSSYGTACITGVWELTDSAPGMRTLTYTEETRTSDCASPVTATRTTVLTGLSDTTRFRYENTVGRSMTFAGGKLVSAPGAAPAGITQAAWDSAAVHTIRLSGTVHELLTDRDITVNAYRSAQILR